VRVGPFTKYSSDDDDEVPGDWGSTLQASSLAILVLATGLTGCASQALAPPPPSLRAASSESVAPQRAVRSAAGKKRVRVQAAAWARPPAALDAAADASNITGTVGGADSESQDNERMRRILRICANCGIATDRRP
jgi:hypothetical protein